MPRLSVCIPTFDRERLVRTAVESVLTQADGLDLEVMVSDNASTDGTPAVLEALHRRDPRVRFHRRAENGGADRNYLEVVDRASGEWCWFLGSDDAAAPGALATILASLDGADVLLFERVDMDATLTRRLAVSRFLDAADGATFDCARPGELERWLGAVRNLGGVFSYISSVAVRRQAWLAQPAREAFVGSAYVHAARLLDVLAAGGRLRYLARPLVLNRTENDSFQQALGIGRRRRLDFNYVAIADACLGGRPAAREALVRAVERDVFRPAQILWDKRMAAQGGPAQLAEVRAGYEALRGRPGWAARRLLFDLAPAALLDLAYRGLIPLVRAARRRRAG